MTQSPAAVTPASVLVVDDEPTNISILAQLLTPHYQVLVANSGARALELANADARPDLILLDVMMPGMSGFEVCEHLKSSPMTADIPVIFVTALSDEHSEEKGFGLGAVDYISKPVVPAIVLARVRAQLALHNQTRALEQLVGERTVELNETRLKIIQRLGRAAEYRDNETGMRASVPACSGKSSSHQSRLASLFHSADWANSEPIISSFLPGCPYM